MRYEKGSFTVVPNINALKGQSPILQVLYMWICKFSNEDGYCWPSQKHLAECAGISHDTCQRYIQKMKKLGLLQQERRFVGNSETSSKYFLCVPPAQKGDPPRTKTGPPPAQKGDPPRTKADGTITSELTQSKLYTTTAVDDFSKNNEQQKIKLENQNKTKDSTERDESSNDIRGDHLPISVNGLSEVRRPIPDSKPDTTTTTVDVAKKDVSKKSQKDMSELKKFISKWLSGFENVNSPDKFAESIMKKYPLHVVLRSINDSAVVSIQKFYEVADYQWNLYKKRKGI